MDINRLNNNMLYLKKYFPIIDNFFKDVNIIFDFNDIHSFYKFNNVDSKYILELVRLQNNNIRRTYNLGKGYILKMVSDVSYLKYGDEPNSFAFFDQSSYLNGMFSSCSSLDAIGKIESLEYIGSLYNNSNSEYDLFLITPEYDPFFYSIEQSRNVLYIGMHNTPELTPSIRLKI